MSRNNVNIDTNTLNYYNSTFVNTKNDVVTASLKETIASFALLSAFNFTPLSYHSCDDV